MTQTVEDSPTEAPPRANHRRRTLAVIIAVALIVGIGVAAVAARPSGQPEQVASKSDGQPAGTDASGTPASEQKRQPDEPKGPATSKKEAQPPALMISPPPIYEDGPIAQADVDPEVAKIVRVTGGYGVSSDDAHYYIVAGSSQVDQATGEVLVESSNDVNGGTTWQPYSLDKVGPLTIRAVALPSITVSTDRGSTYILDVATGKFSKA